MITIETGHLLSLVFKPATNKASLLERFFLTEKPIAKYFKNRNLSDKVFADAMKAMKAHDAIHERHGGRPNLETGKYEIPVENRAACQAELSALRKEVLTYDSEIKVKAEDLVNFTGTEQEMKALAPFIEE